MAAIKQEMVEIEDLEVAELGRKFTHAIVEGVFIDQVENREINAGVISVYVIDPEGIGEELLDEIGRKPAMLADNRDPRVGYRVMCGLRVRQDGVNEQWVKEKQREIREQVRNSMLDLVLNLPPRRNPLFPRIRIGPW